MMGQATFFPHLENTFWVGDRISAACDATLINEPESELPYLDPYFGHTWAWTPRPGTAVYGRTASLPRTPIEDHGNGHYLRVPFRRVPIVEISSVTELLSLAAASWSQNPAIRGVWRGQAQEYFLPRDVQDRMRLYGDEDALEPSLLPSACRAQGSFAKTFLAWSAVLDVYIDTQVDRLCTMHLSNAGFMREMTAFFRDSLNYRAWGLATAQHYGVPSSGVDLTPDIKVALFFALHRFEIHPVTKHLTVVRADASARPVIYGLGVYEKDLIEDHRIAPAWLQCARPKAQRAMFATAWGSATNRAADRIYVVLRLVDHDTWESPLDVSDLFPNGPDDPFVESLLASRARFASTEIDHLLGRIYFRL